jgi:hypothetical protein
MGSRHHRLPADQRPPTDVAEVLALVLVHGHMPGPLAPLRALALGDECLGLDVDLAAFRISCERRSDVVP